MNVLTQLEILVCCYGDARQLIPDRRTKQPDEGMVVLDSMPRVQIASQSRFIDSLNSGRPGQPSVFLLVSWCRGSDDLGIPGPIRPTQLWFPVQNVTGPTVSYRWVEILDNSDNHKHKQAFSKKHTAFSKWHL
jgi:hypothetical protein